jgi:hypothetical protein
MERLLLHSLSKRSMLNEVIPMKISIPTLTFLVFALTTPIAFSQAEQIIGNTSSEPSVRATDANVVPNFDFAFPQNTSVNERRTGEGQVEFPAEGQVEFPVGGQVIVEVQGQVDDFATGNIPPYADASYEGADNAAQMEAETQDVGESNLGQASEVVDEQTLQVPTDANSGIDVDPNVGMTADR